MIDNFRGKHRFLSNFSMSDIVVWNRLVPTVEHAFQAAKAIDPEQRDAILAAPAAGDAKRLGKKADLKPDWEDIKEKVMFELLQRKFRIEDLRKKLISTDPHELIEGNTWGDTYWGVYNGVGKNRLGMLLMALRRRIILLGGM